MADFSSRLPVENLGSVAISSQAVWTGVGSVLVTGSVNLGAAMTAWTGIGSVLTTGSVNIAGNPASWTGVGSVLVTGSVNLGAAMPAWTGVGSALVTGSVNLNNPWPGVGSVLVTGSVNVSSSINAEFGQEANAVTDYNTVASVAAGGSSIHWYAATGSFYIMAVKGSFSGKGKVSVGTGSPTATIKATSFNSTAHPDCDIAFPDTMGLFVGSNTRVQVVRFNREASDTQDVYSTIFGVTNP